MQEDGAVHMAREGFHHSPEKKEKISLSLSAIITGASRPQPNCPHILLSAMVHVSSICSAADC